MPAHDEHKTPEGIPIRSGRKRIEVHDGEEPARRIPGSAWWLAGALIALLLAFFVILPGYRGYQVYRAMHEAGVPDTYATDMVGLQTAKEKAELGAQSAIATATEAERQRAAAQESLDQCMARSAQEKDAAGERIEALEDGLAAAKDDLAACTAGAQAKDAVIADAARRICCVQRVDNPSINGFVITDGRIACVMDGGTAISC